MTATARLRSLSPHVLRAIGTAPRAAAFTRHRGTFARRRGKAVEPQPIGSEKVRSLNASSGVIGGAASRPVVNQSAAEQQPTQPTPTEETPSEPNTSSQNFSTQPGEATSSKPQPKENETPQEERARLAREEAKQSGPLEAVLHMQPPETMRSGPAMCPPPYIHHFDSYSLVKQLQEGGYSQEQATTAMKAIRALLAQNLDIAQSTLVSKSDVENVSSNCTGRSDSGG